MPDSHANKDKIIFWEDIDSVSKLRDSLKGGRVCVATSDTVLGLLADTTQKGYGQLNTVKGRCLKPYIVLIDSIDKLPLFTDINFENKKITKLINNCWPGPLTIIFKSKSSAGEYLKSTDDKIAIRIPQNRFLLQLLTFFNGLFSTSANLAGKEVPSQIEQLDSVIINSVEYIVLDKINEKSSFPNLPSTIIDCTQDEFKILREGAFSVKKLQEYL